MGAGRMHDGPEASTIFADRADAGRKLASRLAALSLESPAAYGIARGGAVIAAEIAKALKCPMDVLVPRKIPAPYHSEVAIGAVTEDGTVLLDDPVIKSLGVGAAYLEPTIDRVQAEIARRAAAYRGNLAPLSARGHDAILVDDGIATGFTVAAAARSLRQSAPRQIVLAVPVAAASSLAWIAQEVDQVVCLSQPEPFYAVSQAYRNFAQVGDAEVTAILRAQRLEQG